MRSPTIPYEQVRAAIAADLVAAATDEPTSVARLVGDLATEIQEFRERGGTYTEVSKTFTRHGVEANADSIRVALKRLGTSRVSPAIMKAKAAPTTPAPIEDPVPDWTAATPIEPPPDLEVIPAMPRPDALDLPAPARAPVIGRRPE